MRSNKENMVGRVFPTNNGGDCVIVEYTNSKNVIVEFIDDNKCRVKTNISSIYRGGVRNRFSPSVHGVGYIGEGRYNCIENGKPTLAYKYWRGIMQRCYDEGFLKRRPTYRGCSVCDEWHNFQVFAEWFYKQNFIHSKYELDKDLLVRGNKTYCPETCCFVPRQINTILNNCSASRGCFPQGVSISNVKGKYRSRLRVDGLSQDLGIFNTVEEAQNVYKRAKESNVKVVANRWRGRIDEDLFQVLMSWELQ